MKPAIVLAAEASNVYAAARLYAAQGLSVLPCTGKKPALRTWEYLQRVRATSETIDAWHRVDLLENVGVICGAVSRGLVVIDLDGEQAIETLRQEFPELFDTYRVASGSGHGMHLYYYLRDVPPTTRVVGTEFGNIELRSNGSYVVAPPSIHPDSHRPYTVDHAREIASMGNLNDVVAWIKSLIADKHGGKLPPPSRQTQGGQIRHATAYGRAALMGECDKVRAALAGGRNNVLYEAALRLGSLIRDEKAGRGEVEQALMNAAHSLSATDGEAATWRTIQSGIDAGMENSRERYSKRA